MEKPTRAPSKLIVIGASSGGVAALRTLVADLPHDFPVPILVVLHIGAHRSTLPALLNAAGPLFAKHGEDGEAILAGGVYVAPPDRHMIVADGHIRLLRGPKENCARPAIDPLFRSAAETFGESAVGVILSGNLNDGTLGLYEIKRHGGVAIAQNPGDAVYPEMPQSAVEHVAIDYCLPLTRIPEMLIGLVNQKDTGQMANRKISTEPDRHARDIYNNQMFDRPLTVTCPDCGGALKMFKFGSIVKFGCHIGHSYTAEIMAAAQFEDMEKGMRAAIRFLNERAEFCLQMADQTGQDDNELSAEWLAASKQALDRAYNLRDLVQQDWITPELTRKRSADNQSDDKYAVAPE